MATEFTRTSLRLAAATVLAGGLAACSTIESLDPTGLLGGSSSDAGGLSDAGAATTDDASQPDVASVPDRPEPPSSPSENAAVTGALQQDAANIQYSAEALRGGTEAAAPPPGNAPPDTQVAQAASADEGSTPAGEPATNVTPGTQGAEAAPEAQPQPAEVPPSDSPASTERPAAAPPETENTDTTAAPAAEPATQVQVASAGPVPGAQSPVTRRAAPVFAPSKAPPLDPTVTQFVPPAIVARYKQTAELKPSVFPDYPVTLGYFGPATATVLFPGDTTILDAKGLQQVRAATELFKSQGGQGYVRVVGYASANSGNLSAARLMQINFDHSQARATAIARALMREGVPANKILIDAAPQTAAIAKAEIYVQG